jgi:hypothetical protein
VAALLDRAWLVVDEVDGEAASRVHLELHPEVRIQPAVDGAPVMFLTHGDVEVTLAPATGCSLQLSSQASTLQLTGAPGNALGWLCAAGRRRASSLQIARQPGGLNLSVRLDHGAKALSWPEDAPPRLTTPPAPGYAESPP